MYPNIMHSKLDQHSEQILTARRLILEQIPENSHMHTWYTDKGWNSVKYTYCDLLTEQLTGDIVSLNGNVLWPDNSLRILGRLFVLKNKRQKYMNIHQTNIIPNTVSIAQDLGLKSVWYSFHLFDNKHKMYSMSQKKQFKGSNIQDWLMPYRESFKYVGQHTINGILQDKFEFIL